jgi:hypothetical protein
MQRKAKNGLGANAGSDLKTDGGDKKRLDELAQTL